MKKLKLRIAKFDRLLVVEQLERTGEWKNSEHAYIQGDLFLFTGAIELQGKIEDRSANYREFSDNAKRDEYAANLIKWISEEQFGGVGKLEVGKMCDVSDDGKTWTQRIYAGKVDKHFGEEKRFLAFYDLNNYTFGRWEYAKPSDDCLKIDGDVYTWEV